MHSYSPLVYWIAFLLLFADYSSANQVDEGQCSIVTKTITGQWTWVPQESISPESMKGQIWEGHAAVNSTSNANSFSPPSKGSSISAQTKGQTRQGWQHQTGHAVATSVIAPSDTTETETGPHVVWDDWSTPAHPASTNIESWKHWSSPADEAYSASTQTKDDWSSVVKSTESTGKLSTRYVSSHHNLDNNLYNDIDNDTDDNLYNDINNDEHPKDNLHIDHDQHAIVNLHIDNHNCNNYYHDHHDHNHNFFISACMHTPTCFLFIIYRHMLYR
ncbi:hypothetical protein CLAIMM_02683 [Cladophialophora immunda]|nr:hypothetical protein CLAIMM_02683 [Cladophialophora immunda]